MKNCYGKRFSTSLRTSFLLAAMFLLATSGVWAQGRTVRGKIVDQEGKASVGAIVIVKGTTTGTTANASGEYSIVVPSDNSVLQFSYLGYETQEITVGTRSVINVTLTESSQVIDDVVVIGYGSVRRSDVTGALSSVSAKTIQERPVADALDAVQGKAAGVDIQTNIRPGQIPAISIRGTRSLVADNTPLIVVDGVILMGTMNDVNPNEIASMEILKDASATAIYGSRGANGVILITTKRGAKGRVSIDYAGNVSFDNMTSTTDWGTAGETMDRTRLARINGGNYSYQTVKFNYPNPFADIESFANKDINVENAIRQGYEWNDDGSVKTRTTTQEERDRGLPAEVPIYHPERIPTTDWIGMLTRVGITNNHQVAVTAGNEISSLYTSIGYFSNKGAQLNQDFTRYNARMNGEIKPVKWLSVGTNLNLAFSEQKYGRQNRAGSATGANDLYGIALSQYVMAQPFTADGSLIENPGGNTTAPLWNPFIDLRNTDDLVRTMNIQANGYADVIFTPWLKYHLNLGTGYRNATDGRWQGSQSTLRRNGIPPTASASFNNSVNMRYLVENILYFNKTYDIHEIGLTFVQAAEREQYEYINLANDKLIKDVSKWFDLRSSTNATPTDYGTDFWKKTMLSFLFRANYGLMQRYLFSFTIRRDGASVLAPGNKWDSFPAFAFAWKMQEEEFMRPITWIDELKVRFGYGITGNSSVNPYTSTGPLARYNYVFEKTTPAIGMIPYRMPNPALSWERVEVLNFGVDFSFLRSRLNGTIEIYRSNTRNLIMDRAIIAPVGYLTQTANIGKLRNDGLEITLSSINFQERDFRWTTDFNFSTNKEQIIELVNGKEDMPGNNWYIGYPTQIFRNYQLAGLWQNTPEDLAEIAKWNANGYRFQPGQFKPLEHGTPNYRLDDQDKIILGSIRPKAILGLTNNFMFKDWEFSFFIYARLGQKYFSSLIPGNSAGGNYIGYARSVDPSEFWSPTNPGGRYPEPTSNTSAINGDLQRASYVNNGSFFVVRNISFAYNFPQRMLRDTKIQRLQLYGQIINPYLWGGEVVRAGINPDDNTGWTSVNSTGDPTGGANNNTIIITSFALGARLGF